MMLTIRSSEFPKSGFFDYTIYEKTYYAGELRKFYADFLQEYQNPSKKYYNMEFLTRYKETPETETGRTLVWEYQLTYNSTEDKFLMRSYMEIYFVEVSFPEFCSFVEDMIARGTK